MFFLLLLFCIHVYVDYDRTIEAFEIASQVCIGLGLVIPLIITIIGCGVHRSGNMQGFDRPRYPAVWKTFCNMADFYTDIIFAMVLIVRSHWLAWYCAFFTFVPHFIGNIICLVKMQMWREKDKYVSKYVDKYDWFLIIVSVFAGFYSAIEIARSRLFYLSLFGLQIRRSEYTSSKTWRFFNNVILELSMQPK